MPIIMIELRHESLLSGFLHIQKQEIQLENNTNDRASKSMPA
jgi:hypothetical protein